MGLGVWRTYRNTIQKQQRFDLLQKEVLGLETESEKLKKEAAYRQSPAFIEAEARNNLKMVKEGEHLLVVSDLLPEALRREATPEASSAALPIWRQWWKVIFGS